MNHYAIGDIQGCYKSFQALLKTFNFRPSVDQLWLVGDVVNRGPDSLSVLRWCSEHADSIRCVLGNHDLHLLAIAQGIKPIKKKEADLQRILEADDATELLEWLARQPLIHHDPTLDYCMVHAGLPPTWPLEQCLEWGAKTHQALQHDLPGFLQDMYGNHPACWSPNLSASDTQRFVINSFTRMRMCKTDRNAYGHMDFEWKGPPEQANPGLTPWFALPDRANHGQRIIFGHWSALGRIHWQAHNVWGIDTGCVWGRQLTALRLEDQKIFQVDALESPHKK